LGADGPALQTFGPQSQGGDTGGAMVRNGAVGLLVCAAYFPSPRALGVEKAGGGKNESKPRWPGAEQGRWAIQGAKTAAAKFPGVESKCRGSMRVAALLGRPKTLGPARGGAKRN